MRLTRRKSRKSKKHSKRFNKRSRKISNKRYRRNRKNSKYSRKKRRRKSKKYIRGGGFFSKDNASDLKEQEEKEKAKNVKNEELLKELTDKIMKIIDDNSENYKTKIKQISDTFIKYSGDFSDEINAQIKNLGKSFTNLDPKCMSEDELKQKIEESMQSANGIVSTKGTSKIMNMGIGFGVGSLVTFLLAEGIPLLYKHFKS